MSNTQLGLGIDAKELITPPKFCEYSRGSCNQKFSDLTSFAAFFIYANEPKTISGTLQEAVKQLKNHSSQNNYRSWRELDVGGRIIFCEICKALRTAKLIVADITTLNFNVLFEIGYAIGLGKAVLPIRDITYARDKKLFEELGIFDVLGYNSFQNAQEIVSIVTEKERSFPVIHRQVSVNREAPVYYIRSPVDTDGSVKLLSCLKKGFFSFRTFDARETPRLSLHEAYAQVHSSISVVAHLMDPQREGALVHNARCAFVCGMAMAAQKDVLILQESYVAQPIDYRDVVVIYERPEQIPLHVDKFLRATFEVFKAPESGRSIDSRKFLEKIDMGDVAAENEIFALSSYFVKTPHYQQATKGHARLIVGRKGSGKTALFYGVRKRLCDDKANLVLDLKPEGHQFVRLREVVLSTLTEGMQLHTLTAFWNYLLMLEIAKKIIDKGSRDLWSTPDAARSFRKLELSYIEHAGEDEGDFSERVLNLVERVIRGVGSSKDKVLNSGAITEIIYGRDIKDLQSALVECLHNRDHVWILVDNLDKGWTYLGTHREDISILRCLLEATRKIGRWFEANQLGFNSIVFIRKDIYDFLVDQTPDRGKEAVANLDWSDIELIKQLVNRRLVVNEELKGRFDEVWTHVFDAHVMGENSFSYIINRTFLRPRDILNFIRKSIEIAVSRDRDRVHQEDIRAAEVGFSEDMLNDLKYEIRDVASEYPDLLAKFIGKGARVSDDDLRILLMENGVSDGKLDEVIDRLLWFCFLGIEDGEDGRYAYQLLYNIPKLKTIALGKGRGLYYTIHPAFHMALECFKS